MSEQPQFEIFASGIDHPECLAFDREGNLWAGGEAGQVYRIDASGQVNTVATLGGFHAGLAFSPLDHALYVCNTKLGIFRVLADGSHSLFATHAGDHKIVCPNYPLFDRRGRLYVTDSGKWKQRNGYLLRFEGSDGGSVVGGPFGYANGLAFSGDERNLYMVESDTDRVLRFVLTSDGEVGSAEVYAEKVGRLPDGLALDEAGNLYVACYASDEIWRISPTGEKSVLGWDYHAILVSRPTNLAWGQGNSEGANRDVLYVANLGRDTITRAHLPGVRGQRLAHQY
ncbi:MAG TPA: SMP-30/gluconolactonase/LRE family protein [Pirellulaceae bacterium]|jgi:gluconolactonase